MSPLRFLVTLLALLALTSPGLAVGMVAMSASAASVALAVESDAPVPTLRPCGKQAGKPVLPCQPDTGLPPLAVAQMVWDTAPPPAPVTEPMLPERAPKTDPPPPRRR